MIIYNERDVVLHHSSWEDALPEIGMVDAIVTDPPYSERTHVANDDVNQDLHFASWSPEDATIAAIEWSKKCRGWIVVMTDHVLLPAWERGFKTMDRYVFAPLPFVKMGGGFRVMGDGPSSWTVWIIVARPRNREYATWGCLPGAYIQPRAGNDQVITGGKTIWIMQQLVEHYTRHGEVVLDPCAGAGTTGLACRMLGRKSVLIECRDAVLPETLALLRGNPRPMARQEELFGSS